MKAAFWQRAALVCSWPRHTILRRLGRVADGADRKLLAAYWWCLDRRDRVEGRSHDVPF